MQKKNEKSPISSSKLSASEALLEAALKAIPFSNELKLSKKSIQNIVQQVGEMSFVNSNANKKN